GWRECRFEWRDGTPPLREATATLVFPETRLEVDVTPETRIYTNRAYCLMGYVAHLEAGPRAWFRPMGYQLDREHRFRIGGKLTPHAWADYMRKPVPENPAGRHVVWRFALVDEGQHLMDVSHADSGVRHSVRRVDGQPLSDGPVDDA